MRLSSMADYAVVTMCAASRHCGTARVSAADLAEERSRRVQEFKDRFANPYLAAERGYIDEVIAPRDTRRKLITALNMLDTKRDKNPHKKHGNIPL